MNLFDPDTPACTPTASARNDRREYIDGLAGPGFFVALRRAQVDYYRKWDAFDDYKSSRRSVIGIGGVAGCVIAAMVATKVWQVSLVALALIILSIVLGWHWRIGADNGARLEAELDEAEARYCYLEEHPWELGEDAA